MRRLRLAAIALVAQGAMNSLNPVTRVRDQFADALRDHGETLTRRRIGRADPRAACDCRAEAGGRRQISARTQRRHETAGRDRDRDQPAGEE